jgi:hypothetical protein
VSRTSRAVAWAVIIACFPVAWVEQSLPILVGCIVVACTCVVWILLSSRHDRRQADGLPRSLARLAYRSDETAVAFVWRWRHRRDKRLRILRSVTRGSKSVGGDAGTDQTSVFDGFGDQVIDRDVTPRQTYYYSFFVEEDRGRWSQPVHETVLTLAPDDQAQIEASFESPRWADAREHAGDERDVLGTRLAPDPLTDPHGVDVERARAMGDDGVAVIVGSALAAVATDAVFAVADIFVGRKPGEGWREIT